MAVTINSVSGSGAHGATLQIIGSGFGSKPIPAPVVWDPCDGIVNAPSELLKRWSGCWPSAGTAAYQLQYRQAPFRNISAPHGRVGQIMAGAHGEAVGADQGYNVMAWKTRTVASFPALTYASWYQRCDDAWVFGLGFGDSNFKIYDWSSGLEPYSPTNWYTEYNPRPTSRTATPGWHVNDDGTNLEAVDTWGAEGANPMAGAWTRVEHYLKFSDQPGGGFIRIVENGVTKLDITTRTDTMGGTDRNDAIGGYSRDDGNGNNYRYFADLYLDHTLQHVALGNAATGGQCSILEPQVPQTWTDGAITVNVNRGRLLDGANAYLYVYDASGTPNPGGFLVTSVGDNLPPGPATNLRII